MPIHSLPEKDTKSLTSGQIIVDVVSIVKELLENSIDALATSITITLEGNGLDSITVKDNGQGIPAADRALLARHHCTSKISDFNDIQAVRTYGFRGEALFSLAEISQRFKVTTRTSMDPIATVSEIDSNGRLRVVKTSSDPVGSSITVGKPWYKLPVRRDCFRRRSRELFPKIKHLLHTYSLVHPKLRLQLTSKATKITEQTGVLLLTPQHSYEEAISALIGTEAFESCISIDVTFADTRLQAVLPRMNASSVVSARGHFLYVDKRPMSCSQECFKQILKTIRTKVASVAPESGKDPFIFLNIIYGTGSYDPNLEPSKDNVMLYKLDELNNAIQALFDSAYSREDLSTVHHSKAPISAAIVASPNPPSSDQQCENQSEIQGMQFEKVKQKPRHSQAHSLNGQALDESMNGLSPRTETDGHWKFSMFDEEDDDGQVMARTSNGVNNDTETDFVADRPILNNPWTLAKMATRGGAHARRGPYLPIEPSSDVLLSPAEDTFFDVPSTSVPSYESPIAGSRSSTGKISLNSVSAEQRPLGVARKRSLAEMKQNSSSTDGAGLVLGKRSTIRSQKVLATSSSPDQPHPNERQAKIATGGPSLYPRKKRIEVPHQSLVDDGVARDAAIREHPGLYHKASSATPVKLRAKTGQILNERSAEASVVVQSGRGNIHTGARFSPQKLKLPLETTDVEDQVQNLRTRMPVSWTSICEEAAHHALDTTRNSQSPCRLDAQATDVLVPLGSLAGNLQLTKAVSKENSLSALFVHRRGSESTPQQSDTVLVLNDAQQKDIASLVRIW